MAWVREPMVVYTHMEIAPNHPCHFRSFHENHGPQVNKCKWSTFLLGSSHRNPPRRETHLRCLSGDVCKMATSCCRSQRIPAWRLPLRWATHLVNWFVNGLEWYCNITMTIYHDLDILGYVEGYFVFSLGYIYIYKPLTTLKPDFCRTCSKMEADSAFSW